MKPEQIKRLETVLDRELSSGEIERMERIKNVFGLSDDDTFWDILAAMDYQRAYYDELPKKIAAASTEIVQGISIAAEKEVSKAQSLLAESVVEQAKKMSLRINVETLLPMGLVALVCLFAFGSLLMWAGFSLGSGRMNSPEWLLRMPSGFIMAGLCFGCGIFLGTQAAKDYAEGGKGWIKKMSLALALLVPGGLLISLSV